MNVKDFNKQIAKHPNSKIRAEWSSFLEGVYFYLFGEYSSETWKKLGASTAVLNQIKTLNYLQDIWDQHHNEPSDKEMEDIVDAIESAIKGKDFHIINKDFHIINIKD